MASDKIMTDRVVQEVKELKNVTRVPHEARALAMSHGADFFRTFGSVAKAAWYCVALANSQKIDVKLLKQLDKQVRASVES